MCNAQYTPAVKRFVVLSVRVAGRAHVRRPPSRGVRVPGNVRPATGERDERRRVLFHAPFITPAASRAFLN